MKLLSFPLLSLLVFLLVQKVTFSQKSPSNSLFPSKLLDSEGKEVSASVLQNKIVGIYFSAQWCPPCRHFTPSLVEFRNKNSKDFEVVFVSSDRSSKDQLEYMKKYNMKWYTIAHGSDAANALKKKYEIRGIPSLVIVDENGKTISKNGRADVSQNPRGALKDWKKSS
ncbi:MAG: thioredoxin family protein [Opitutae bacterium]